MSNADSLSPDRARSAGQSGVPHQAALAEATYGKILWRIMPLLMLVYVVSFIDRSNVGFAKLHFLADLGFDDAIYGIGAGIFYVGYILFEVPSNLWLQKIGARKTLLRIMVLWGLFCTALAFMQSQTYFYAMRFLLGAAEAGLFPGMLLYLTYWVPLSRRARFTALFTASIPLAGLIGGPLSGWLMHVFDGVAGMRGWQWLFIVEGLPACALGVAAYLYLDDKPGQSRWLSPEQRALVQADMDADQAGKPRSGGHSLRDALVNPQLYWLAGMGVAVLVGTGGIFFWLPTIIRKAGVESISMIGMLSAIPFAAAIVLQYLNARHSDRTGERRWHVAIPSVIAGIGWIALPSVQGSIPLSLLMLTLVTAGTFSLTGPFWIIPAQFLSGTALAAGIALLSTLAGIGSVFSPMLVGWLSSTTGSLSTGQYYFGAWMLLGAVTLLIGVKPPKRAA
ncbi:MFS transporter [Herbaspirillum sp. YR522]|uniref:MFS transporter n=1 Tax=Herbaspirillum sp. YR522 TaxID=1144342 RepID=UPI00026F7615|nr:MFS transporter [Herbaspirillum sp. YR522]EJN09994.1 sugar phosphate permease [Herbaspirillum sp. YR522]